MSTKFKKGYDANNIADATQEKQQNNEEGYDANNIADATQEDE